MVSGQGLNQECGQNEKDIWSKFLVGLQHNKEVSLPLIISNRFLKLINLQGYQENELRL